MVELADLEVDDDIALELDVVENQVRIEMVAVQRQPQLAANEGEAAAQLEQEALQLRDQRFLEPRLVQARHLGQVEELQHIRVFDQVCGLSGLQPLVSQRQHTLLVAALGEALEQQRGDLPLQLPRRPGVLHRFDFVEIACLAPRHLDQRPVVRPGQPGVQCPGAPCGARRG